MKLGKAKTCQGKGADGKHKAAMLHAVTILGLTETVIQTEGLLVLGYRYLLARTSQEHRHRVHASSPSLCSSSMFLARFNTKSVTREWTVGFGKFLLPVWNLTRNLKVKSKHMHLPPWRFPGLAFLLLCTLYSHLRERKIIMIMSNQLPNPKKWEVERDTSDFRTASETKRNLRNLIPDLSFTCSWLWHLRPHYHNLCC